MQFPDVVVVAGGGGAVVAGGGGAVVAGAGAAVVGGAGGRVVVVVGAVAVAWAGAVPTAPAAAGAAVVVDVVVPRRADAPLPVASVDEHAAASSATPTSVPALLGLPNREVPLTSLVPSADRRWCVLPRYGGAHAGDVGRGGNCARGWTRSSSCDATLSER
jgi:hypothetical protein